VLTFLDLWEDAASEAAVQLGAIGVAVRPRILTSDAELDAAIEEGPHAFMWGWGAAYPDPAGVLQPFLHDHPWVYRDAELEQLLARAASLRDQDERLRTYREFERIWIGEHVAVVPLKYGERKLWRRPWVEGMWANAIAMSTFASAVVERA
jgi:ABC-type transport system substrate-binding protein